MGQTSKGIVYPSDYSVVADVPEDMKKMADSIDTIVTQIAGNIQDNQQDISKNQQDIAAQKEIIQRHDKELLEQKAINETFSLITETGNQIDFQIDYNTYKIKMILKDKNGNEIYVSNQIELPINSLIKNIAYDSSKKEIVATKQDGTTIKANISSLINGLASQSGLDAANANITKNTNAIQESSLKIDSTIEIVDDLYNALNTKVASGVNLEIDDAKPCRIIKGEFYGKSEQNTTTGKNLFVFTNSNTISANAGAVINLKDYDNQIIKFTSGKNITNTGFYIPNILDINDTYSFQCKIKLSVGGSYSFKVGSDDSTYKSYNFTANVPQLVKFENIAITRHAFIVYISATNISQNIDIEVSDIMAEKDTKCSEYERYTGGVVSPNPIYPQAIESINKVEYMCRNKNLCDGIMESGTINSTTGDLIDHASHIRTKNFIRIKDISKVWIIPNKPRETFILGIRLYDKDKHYLGFTTYASTEITTGKNLKTCGIQLPTSYYNSPDDYYYLKFVDTTANGDLALKCGVYVEKTDYIEYKGSSCDIDLKGNLFRSIGKFKDRLIIDMKTGDYYKETNIEEVLLDGSEAWSSVPEAGKIRFITSSLQGLIKPLTIVSSNRFVCEGTGNTLLFKDGCVTNPASGSVSFCYVNENIKTAEDFKNWVKDNKIQLIYQLATPRLDKIGTLTDEEKRKLCTINDINYINVFTNIDNTDFKIEYVEDLNKIIEKLETRIEMLETE